MSTGSKQESLSLRQEKPGREWIIGFLLLGILVGLLGSLLIAWQYHIDTDPEWIGLHFLAFNAGYVLAVFSAQKLLLQIAIRSVALLACCIGFLGLLALCFLGPPVPTLWRMSGLAVIGISSGAIATSLLHVLEPWFARTPALAMNVAGALFGAGCTLATLVGGTAYFAGSTQMETALLALAPLIFFFVFFSSKNAAARLPFLTHPEEDRKLTALKDIRSVAAVLFSLLLFFQSGNEFVIAGWLPLFLIHRLGANPVLAIMALATYFLALTLGRVLVRKWLPTVTHRKLLFGSVLVAMAGYLTLSFAPSMAWVWPATVLVGAGFAPIYPLLAEILDHRFSYHPGFYNGIFSIAVTGAMSIPWLIGYVDTFFGASYIMTIPAIGSVLVAGLTLLIMFEARLMTPAIEIAPQEKQTKAAAAGQGG